MKFKINVLYFYLNKRMSGNLISSIPVILNPIPFVEMSSEISELVHGTPQTSESEVSSEDLNPPVKFDDAFIQYYINHNKDFKKYFKITNTKLIKEHQDIFNIKNRLINILPDKIEEAKNILREFFDDLTKRKTYKTKSTYTLKTTGETKEYENEISYRYKPKVKKFDFLRNNEQVVNILNDKNIRQCDKVHLIYDVLTDDEKKQVCISNLSNFVYREGYKNNS